MCSIVLITLLAGIQEPKIHDELAQLVQADIFAHGRLAEPPHPFWQHFETMHVLSQPKYQAKYPPAPALFMAAGQTLTGLPIVGVWLSVAVMILSTGYAMHSLLPGSWAVLGTFLVTLRFGVVGDWADSYWGGSVAAAGGALVIGALARLCKAPTLRDGALLGTGFVLLALSRPYEGLAYSVPVFVILAWQLCRRSPTRPVLWRTVVSSTAIVVALGCGWLCYYNWRVTGSPLTPPYLAYERTYSAAPLFVWQAPRDPAPLFRHKVMETFEREFVMQEALRAQRLWPAMQIVVVTGGLWDYLKAALFIAVVGFPLSSRKIRVTGGLAAAPLLSMLAALTLSCWVYERSLAPATAPLFALVTMGLSGLWHAKTWFNGRVVGISAVSLLVGAMAAATVHHIVDLRTSAEWWAAKRDIRRRLSDLPGNDLVFVRYAPSHNPHHEWVYNGADIDHQPIVWAREMDPTSDERLRQYFRNRRAWVVLADEQPVRVLAWPERTFTEYQ